MTVRLLPGCALLLRKLFPARLAPLTCRMLNQFRSLQLGIAVLGLFSFFRKVKICVYAAEYDEKAGIRIPENYHDGDLLRGGPSTTSIV